MEDGDGGSWARAPVVYAERLYFFRCPFCGKEHRSGRIGDHGCGCGKRLLVVCNAPLRIDPSDPKRPLSRYQRQNLNMRRRVLGKTGGRCYFCNAQLGALWTVDHLTPIARGGKNEDANRAPTCARCNQKKGNRTEAEFLDMLAKERGGK